MPNLRSILSRKRTDSDAIKRAESIARQPFDAGTIHRVAGAVQALPYMYGTRSPADLLAEVHAAVDALAGAVEAGDRFEAWIVADDLVGIFTTVRESV